MRTDRCSRRWSRATAASRSRRTSSRMSRTRFSRRSRTERTWSRLRRFQRRPGRLRAEAARRARRTRHPRHRHAAQQSRWHGTTRRQAGLPAAGQSGLVSVRLRLLRRPGDSRAGRPFGGLAVSTAANARWPASSFQPSAVSITHGSDRRRSGRTAGHQRRVDPEFHDASRRLRHDPGRQRRLSARRGSGSLLLRHESRWRVRNPMSSQDQFLDVIDRDEAEARFRAALELRPLGRRRSA